VRVPPNPRPKVSAVFSFSAFLSILHSEEEIRVIAASVIVKLQPDCDLTHVFRAGMMSPNPNVRVISNMELSRLKRLQRAR